MSQALRLLETEHQELQAKIEHLQGDKALCSSDTQHLQGTCSVGPLAAEPGQEVRGQKSRMQAFGTEVTLDPEEEERLS